MEILGSQERTHGFVCARKLPREDIALYLDVYQPSLCKRSLSLSTTKYLHAYVSLHNKFVNIRVHTYVTRTCTHRKT